MKTHATLSQEGVYAPLDLFDGDFPRVERKVTIAESGALAAGAVLGRITASGKYLLSLSAADDGSQVPDAILAHDIDASDGDVEAIVYFTGEFRAGALTFGTAHTADSTRVGLRGKSIFI